MLDEPKNRLDEIADDLRDVLNQVVLQASIRRVLDEKLSQERCGVDKCCYAEENEMSSQSDEDVFETARIIGRIEGRFLNLLNNHLFMYSEDALHRYTHEQLFQKIQEVYEELKEIQAEFQEL